MPVASFDTRRRGEARDRVEEKDVDGAVQPMAARPNREGYGYNAVPRVQVTVVR